MRTTLDIDDDVLQAAKELARRERKSPGAVLSELARRALKQASPPGKERAVSRRKATAFRPFAARVAVVNDDTVNALRDAEGG